MCSMRVRLHSCQECATIIQDITSNAGSCPCYFDIVKSIRHSKKVVSIVCAQAQFYPKGYRDLRGRVAFLLICGCFFSLEVTFRISFAFAKFNITCCRKFVNK